MSGRSDSQMSMDIDRDGNSSRKSSTISSSPPPMSPASYPAPNGVNGEASPVPPPHKTQAKPEPQPQPQPQPQPPSLVGEAEAFKAAGNKHFKAKDYTKAIAEYTRGTSI